MRREVEIVANEIWDLVRHDRGAGAERLRFTDIAVIIANAREYDTYATHITSVFQDIHGIPAAVADLSPDSSRIIEAVRSKLGLREEQVYVNLDRYGNTGSATVPLALAQAREEGRIKPGDLVVLTAFGAGFHWAATALEF